MGHERMKEKQISCEIQEHFTSFKFHSYKFRLIFNALKILCMPQFEMFF